ncbi:hypothetical protein [Phaeodactylibacter sp.]|uniref:hypothetical protein n=1 Tax=Phaeodactylibacter sp. TaxID=1940289 RepID=UPI00260042AF|nr:hypothetical protein [Phaeodactylibacter sp.]MCI4650841.1 hypothetical protein [Phaeodactylibacter sp.]MCI5089798.1 hypothetical protein [Phaeodactylibacter sp.]
MIEQITMYTIRCDRCEITAFQDQEDTAWDSKEAAWELAENQGWEKINERHYCPGCYEIDEEDELVVKAGVRIYFEHKAK